MVTPKRRAALGPYVSNSDCSLFGNTKGALVAPINSQMVVQADLN
jgi:hypothetical protein